MNLLYQNFTSRIAYGNSGRALVVESRLSWRETQTSFYWNFEKCFCKRPSRFDLNQMNEQIFCINKSLSIFRSEVFEKAFFVVCSYRRLRRTKVCNCDLWCVSLHGIWGRRLNAYLNFLCGFLIDNWRIYGWDAHCAQSESLSELKLMCCYGTLCKPFEANLFNWNWCKEHRGKIHCKCQWTYICNS